MDFCIENRIILSVHTHPGLPLVLHSRAWGYANRFWVRMDKVLPFVTPVFMWKIKAFGYIVLVYLILMALSSQI